MHPVLRTYRTLFSRDEGVANHLIARWLFLRSLGIRTMDDQNLDTPPM